ncbi:MAG: hypothetical protein APF78_03615 [Sphingomonadales bacterium BRH_c3]|nr:MAG: hypothetical protein APF78_03615 [Sphingomonadales bacterium BRH_c3]
MLTPVVLQLTVATTIEKMVAGIVTGDPRQGKQSRRQLAAAYIIQTALLPGLLVPLQFIVVSPGTGRTLIAMEMERPANRARSSDSLRLAAPHAQAQPRCRTATCWSQPLFANRRSSANVCKWANDGHRHDLSRNL